MQAVEYFVEWALSPTNAVFLRVQTGVYDPSLVGDKAKWFSHVLAHKLFHVYDDASTLAAAVQLQTTARPAAAADDIHSGRWLSAFCFCYDCYCTVCGAVYSRCLPRLGNYRPRR